MKKVLIIIGLFAFLLGITVNSKACEPGYTPYSMPIIYNGCNYIVDFCYKCSPTGADPNNVIVNGWTNMSGSNCPDNGIKGYIDQQIKDLYFTLCDIPPCSGPNDYTEFTIGWPMCAKWVNTVWVNGNGVTQNWFHYEFCEGGICYGTVCLCWDYVTETAVKVCGPFYQTSQVVSCPTTVPVYPPQGMTYNDPWETDCFVMFTCP